jgi:hypothetical protein
LERRPIPGPQTDPKEIEMRVDSYCTFVAYATLKCGRVRRLEVSARCQADAIHAAFQVVPGAVAMSARIESDWPLCDALLRLERRASDREAKS